MLNVILILLIRRHLGHERVLKINWSFQWNLLLCTTHLLHLLIYWRAWWWCRIDLDLLLVVPDLGKRPDLQFLILPASYQLLFVFKPEDLSDGTVWVRLKNEHRVTIFGRPYRHISILVGSDYLFGWISPGNQSALYEMRSRKKLTLGLPWKDATCFENRSPFGRPSSKMESVPSVAPTTR